LYDLLRQVGPKVKKQNERPGESSDEDEKVDARGHFGLSLEEVKSFMT